MANPQLVVLVGVFLVSILLSFLYVSTEGFAAKKGKKAGAGTAKKAGGSAKKAGGSAKKSAKSAGKAAKKSGKAAKKSGKVSGKAAKKSGKAAKKSGKAAKKSGKAAKKSGKVSGKAAKKSGKVSGKAAKKSGKVSGKAAKKTGKASAKASAKKTAKAAAAAAKKKMAGASVEGPVSGVPARSAGMKFSELIQSLIAYTPGRGAGGAPYGSSLGAPAAAAAAGGMGVAAAGGAELINEVRKAVRDEVGSGRAGANATLADRSTRPNAPGTPNVASPGLYQGAALRNPTVSPYGMGQMAGGPVSVVIYPGDFGAQMPPAVDTSQMVPRTNVYGLA